MIELPQRLLAPEPGWTTYADVVVVGSGVAGLTAALEARVAGRVLLVTKALLDAGSTRWAQGGIAAALGPGDTPEEHLHDTLTAGVGLCDEAPSACWDEGPQAFAISARGCRVRRAPDGEIELTREGATCAAHRARGGDATGAEISRAWCCRPRDGRSASSSTRLLDLLAMSGARAGLTLHVLGEGQPTGRRDPRSRVVLATGGMGQVFAATTTPPCRPVTESRWHCARGAPPRTSSSCSFTPRCCGSVREPAGSSR